MRLYLTLSFALLYQMASGQKSTFDFDNEGWKCDGDPQSSSAFWFPTDGNPSGHIEMIDASTGGTWYFVAPAKFLGAKCDAYGKFIRYDQRTDDTSNPNTKADVEIKGGGLTLVFDHPVQPGKTWTHYDLFLREDAGWRLNDPATGPVPSQQQFKSVLADITSLRIRGEYHHFAVDTGGLDNVILESNFSFDLDGDNSSGLTNGDYRADTSCYAQGLVVGDDPVLTSEGGIDSITVYLLNAGPSEELLLDVFPPNIHVVTYSPSHITFGNFGSATTADFLLAIRLLSYLDISIHPLQGVRQVEFKVYAGCGEAGRQIAFLPIFTPPIAGLPGDTTVCSNTPAFSLFKVLKGSPDPGGQWMPATASGSGFLDPAKDPAGVYAYFFPKTGECLGDTSFVTISIEHPPVLRPDTTVCYDDVLRLEHPRDAINWQWSNGSQLPYLNVTGPGVYGISGETAYCSFEDSVEVRFYTCKPCNIYVPNVFSPNDDGENDQWNAFLPCHWQRFRLEVYDRWGSLVFVSEDPMASWDGRMRGKDAPMGVYVWRLEWDAELYGETHRWNAKGDVTLVR